MRRGAGWGALLAGILVLSTALGWGESFNGGFPGAFLEAASSARALSMGGAFSAIAEGPSSLLWNPAGLGFPGRTEISLSHVALYEGGSLQEVGAAHAFRKPLGIGANIVRFSVPDIVQRDSSNNETGSIQDSRTAILLGLAMQPLDTFSAGLTTKFLNQSLGGTSGSAMDFDLGLQAKMGRYRAGLQIQNIMGANLSRDGGSEKLPRGVRFGGAARILGPLLVTADIFRRAQGSAEIRAGLEFAPVRWAALRAGWDGTLPALGGGIRIRDLDFDYGMARHNLLGFSHRISMGYAFGSTTEDNARARAAWRKDPFAQVEEKKDAEIPAYFQAGTSSPKEPESPAAQAPTLGAELDRIPAYSSRKRGESFAVVIGIEKYRSVAGVSYATRDARIFKEYLVQGMGVPEANIKVLSNDFATRSDIENALEVWLKNQVQARGGAHSRVFVYFSGHGAPQPSSGESFIVPYDGLPESIDKTGYPLKRLYEALSKLSVAGSLTVLDTCFSGAGGPRTIMAKGARPLVTIVDTPFGPASGLAAVSAASGGQISGHYEEKQHGLLTYFFIRGLQGEADANADKRIQLRELYEYLRPKVVRQARLDNREQEPQLMPSANLELWEDEPLVELK